MYQSSIMLLAVLICLSTTAFSLSVTANTTTLDCGINNVSFTFDCSFTDQPTS